MKTDKTKTQVTLTHISIDVFIEEHLGRANIASDSRSHITGDSIGIIVSPL